jgi:integrase
LIPVASNILLLYNNYYEEFKKNQEILRYQSVYPDAPHTHPEDTRNIMQTVLSDRHIKSLKAKTSRYDVRDAALPGLAIRVNSDGTKVWSVVVSRGGKRQRVTFGRYPDISLAEARRKAEERKQGGVRKTGTVIFAFEQYLEEIKKTRRAWRDVEQVGRLYLLPLLGHRKIDTLTADDGVELLDLVERKSSANRAAKTLAYLRPFLRWAAGRKRYIPTNPWAVLVPPDTGVVPRERVLNNDELVAIWDFAETAPYPFGPFMCLLILTAQRRGKVAGMRWKEIDAEKRLWTIPAIRHKQGRGHEVLLTEAVIDVINSLPHHSDFLFSTTRRSPISGFGRLKERLDKATGVTEWRLHDLRRTAATRMAEMQIPRFTISRVLGHADTSITAVYDRASYRGEKLEALEKWGKFVAELEIEE